MNQKLESQVAKALPTVLKSIKGLEPIVAANALARAMEIVTLVNSGIGVKK